MNKRIITIIVTIITSLSHISCKKNHESVKLATYTYSTNNRIENLKALSQNLEKILNRPVEVISYPDVASFIKGIKSNEVDIALINTLGYLLLSQDNKHMQPIATLKVKRNAIDNYKTVLLTNTDSINDFNELKNKANDLTMMFVSKGSTSGNLVPRLLLSSIGIKSPENQFKNVTYGGNHTSTFKKLIKACPVYLSRFYYFKTLIIERPYLVNYLQMRQIHKIKKSRTPAPRKELHEDEQSV